MPRVRVTTKKADMEQKIEKNVEPLFDISNMTAKDIRNHPISDDEIRNAIETYYDMQDLRIRTGNRKSAVKRGETEKLKAAGEDYSEVETPVYLQFIEAQFKNTEETISKFLGYYAKNHPVGRWMLSIKGVGPVIAAGMLAYIDINKAKTAGSIWSYAGWDGSRKVRTAGQKITWNPKFRVLCWKLGESFVKTSCREGDIYGHLYQAKKKWYEDKNENGGFAERAAEELKLKNYGKETEAYKAYSQGKLPPAHINAMAKRFAVKMFLSHLFEVWYEYEHGEKPPKPFVEQHLGHVHIIHAPNREILFNK